MKTTSVVAGNWKMNKAPSEARRFIRALRNRLVGIDARADVVVFPPFVSLETAVDAARDTGIRVGAQNASWQSEGALTGEVAPEMLEELGVEYVILGHSERRAMFGETDDDVNRKLLHVLSGRLTPIVCVGEVLEEREAGRTEEVVERQIAASLRDAAPDHAKRLIVAYEPVWAIGTGRTASAEAANAVHRLIRASIAAIFGSAAAGETRILYGGSVKPENAGTLMAESHIDGVLVGGASLDAQDFAQIVQAAP